MRLEAQDVSHEETSSQLAELQDRLLRNWSEHIWDEGGAVSAKKVGPALVDFAPEGNTRLDEHEAAELIPTHLTARGQLKFVGTGQYQPSS